MMFRILGLLTLLACLFPVASHASGNDSLIYTELSSYQTNPFLPQTVIFDRQNRPYYYLACKAGGFITFDHNNPAAPLPIDTIPVTDLLDLEVMNAYQRGDYVYLALGNFFGNNTQESGIAVVDVSTPTVPVLMDAWKTNQPATDKGSAYVYVEGDYAYLAAMTNGLMIFDISDPANIDSVAQYIPDVNWPVANPSSVAMPNARGLAIRDTLLYLAYDAGGVRVLSIADLTAPYQLHQYINQAVISQQQAYNNILLDGDFAYCAVDYCGVEVLDISDRDTTSQAAWWNPWNCDLGGGQWFSSPGHTNQLHLDEDRALLFLSAGGSEMVVVDVSDPMQPDSCRGFGYHGNDLGVWGVDVHEGRIGLTYINALVPFFATWSGVKVLDYTL
ncbi:MAG: hypothetical protein AAF570_27055, partial [Bacteroidota bacterium]